MNNHSLENKKQNNAAHKLGLLQLSVIAIIMATILAVVTQFFIVPAFNEKSANNRLEKIVSKNGSLTAVNTKIVSYNGTRVPETNKDQKALSGNNISLNGAFFMFSNNKNVGQKIVDLYVDLTNKQSRDFMLINENNLKSLIESGNIILRIHPVPSNNKNSLLYGEAISEAVNTTPNRSWNFLYSILKNDIISQNSNNTDIINDIVAMAKKNGINDIDAKSIVNGTFASWLVDAGKDDKLNTGYYPPIIYVNNNLIDKNTNINDPSNFRKVVLQ